MKYDLFDLLNTAIQTNKSILIVEGKDDPQVYSRFAEYIGKDFDIYLINTIENYTSGCDSVIKCVSHLQSKFHEREDNINRILGIIDRDVRPYRSLREGDIDYKLLNGLLVLRHYSFETYFSTRTILKSLIIKLTRANKSDVTEEILNFVESSFEEIKRELYYVSLEALRNACEPAYESSIRYRENITDRNATARAFSLISNKLIELDEFASSKGVTIENIKEICKGKWYHYNYINNAIEQIKKLSLMCRGAEVEQCKACKVGIHQDCSYTFKSGYQASAAYNDSFEYIDEVECKDIIDRLKELI